MKKHEQPVGLEAWKKEFYPIPAEETKPEEALAHSLRKWEGLSVANRKRFGLTADGHDLADSEENLFCIDASSCALCHHFYDSRVWPEEDSCKECPLAIARGGVPCTDETPTERLSPFQRWTNGENSQPMMRQLRKALALQQKS